MSSMNIKEAKTQLLKLEAYFEKDAQRAQEQADALRRVKGSEAAAGEGWYLKDVDRNKCVAQHIRNAIAELG